MVRKIFNGGVTLILASDGFAQIVATTEGKSVEPVPCTGKNCIRKCCPRNMILKELHNTECVNDSDHQNEWKRYDISSDNQGFNNSGLPLVTGFPCDITSFLKPEDSFTISEKGELFFDGKLEQEDANQFCLDFVNETGSIIRVICISYETWQSEENKREQFERNGILLLVSMTFLICTFGVYAILPPLRNFHGKCHMNYFGCLITYSALFNFINDTYFVERKTACIVIAYAMQYSSLASFFWLNIMSFDLWLSFKKLRSFKRVQYQHRTKNFVFYCLYAWGSPLVISVLTMLADFAVIPSLTVKPNFGKINCWFDGDNARFWYFYSIMSVLIIANLFMFITTGYNIFKIGRQWEKVQKIGLQCHNTQEKKRSEQTKSWTKRSLFRLYLILSLVMGVNWIPEVLSQYFEDLSNIWEVTDAANALQGVFTFIMFICNRNVLHLLNKKLWPTRIFIQKRGRSTISTATISTNTMILTKENKFSVRLSSRTSASSINNQQGSQ